MPEIYGSDCYSPKEIAEHVENVGVTKANLPVLSMAALGVLAGGFIGLGALYCTVVLSDATLGFALSRVLGGVAFSLGLILVVVAGAELLPATTCSSWPGSRGASPRRNCCKTSSSCISRICSARRAWP